MVFNFFLKYGAETASRGSHLTATDHTKVDVRGWKMRGNLARTKVEWRLSKNGSLTTAENGAVDKGGKE